MQHRNTFGLNQRVPLLDALRIIETAHQAIRAEFQELVRAAESGKRSRLKPPH